MLRLPFLFIELKNVDTSTILCYYTIVDSSTVLLFDGEKYEKDTTI